MPLDNNFLQNRINHFQDLIIDYEAAILAFKDPTIEQYTINTGQTTQTVKRRSLDDIKKSLDGYYNQLSILNGLLNGGGAKIMRPIW